MDLPRPDLSKLDPDVRAYIETLETELERLRQAEIERLRMLGKPSLAAERLTRPRPAPVERAEPTAEPGEPSEPPTTLNLITIAVNGAAKRTARHLYTCQRRGGMGVFDLDTPEENPPAILTIADQDQDLLLITNLARAFRLPVSSVVEGPLRARGSEITGKLNLAEDERIVAALPEQAQGYVSMVSERGYVRMLRHHVFGEYMKPGMALYDLKLLGPLVSACWSPGDGDLLIATRQGKAIRFPEKGVPPAGGPGIRLTAGDAPVDITGVYDDSGVFLLDSDGKGTIRKMESFQANKTPGTGGKQAINAGQLVAACAVGEDDDIFIVSRLGKIIRFQAAEIPPKEGVVQGVNCMALRGDKCSAAVIAHPQTAL